VTLDPTKIKFGKQSDKRSGNASQVIHHQHNFSDKFNRSKRKSQASNKENMGLQIINESSP